MSDIPSPAFTGDLATLPGVYSPQLGNARDLLVYLPADYSVSRRRYPVLYMHDGQNLFDPATSFSGHWRVGETMDRLRQRGLEAIVVAVPNTGAERLDEYSPFRDTRRQAGGNGDAYLAFLVETVKPLVDRRFRTLVDHPNTGLLGSSMGGLISLYGFFRYPEFFGFAAAMSPSLWFARRAIFQVVERAAFSAGRLYLDIGTSEGDMMVANTRRMAELLHRKGYRLGHELLFVEDQGAEHCEEAWANRLEHPLVFLLQDQQRVIASEPGSGALRLGMGR